MSNSCLETCQNSHVLIISAYPLGHECMVCVCVVISMLMPLGSQRDAGQNETRQGLDIVRHRRKGEGELPL